MTTEAHKPGGTAVNAGVGNAARGAWRRKLRKATAWARAMVVAMAASVALAGCTALPQQGGTVPGPDDRSAGEFTSSIDTRLLPPADRADRVAASAGLPPGPGWSRALRRLNEDAHLPADHALWRATAPLERLGLSVDTRRRDFPSDDMPADALLEDGVLQRGGASWYGPKFHNRRTASGERFDMGEMTAAHRSLPFGTRVCVRSLVNGREVEVRINDRGPHAANRVIDLSQAAAQELGMVGLGIRQVALSASGRSGSRCGATEVAGNAR